jgi:hypothetical protein
MVSKGVFGYIIGKKKRLMEVQKNSDLLWQILVREIYVLMKHFETKENMLTAFEKIKTTKYAPKRMDTNKFRLFTNLESEIKDWQTILHYCQSSFINILEAGYILNHLEEVGNIFILDFNKGKVINYTKDLDGKINKIQTATLEEIMTFDDMPTKSYSEIVSEMNTNFDEFYEKYAKIEEELKNLIKLKIVAKQQNAVNIEEKVNKLIEDMNWEKKKLHTSRKVFFHRLKALDLIEDNESN